LIPKGADNAEKVMARNNVNEATHGTRDESVVSTIVKTAGEFQKSDTDAERSQAEGKGFGKVRNFMVRMSKAMNDFNRPGMVLEAVGDKAAEAYRSVRQASGKSGDSVKKDTLVSIRKIEGKLREIHGRGEVLFPATRGGDADTGNGGVAGNARLGALERIYMTTQIKSARATGDEAMLDKISRWSIGGSAKGQARNVFHFSEKQLDAIVNSLTADERAMETTLLDLHKPIFKAVDVEYFRHTGKHLKEVDYYMMTARDSSMAKAEHYKDVGDEKVLDNLFGLMEKSPLVFGVDPSSTSITKERAYSKLPMMAMNALDALNRVSDDAGNFITRNPIRDWVNDNITGVPEVRSVLAQSFDGSEVLRYFDDFKAKIGGQVNLGESESSKLVRTILGHATVARLASPWVWAKQVMSSVSAANHFGLKYLSSMLKHDRKLIDSVIEESPTLWWRWNERQYDPLLGSDVSRNRSAATLGTRTPFNKVQDFVTGGLRTMDKAAIERIIMMSRDYVLDKNPGLSGEKFVAEVARQADIAVQRTQVATDSLDRSMKERNLTSVFERMLVYMWGARGAQYNMMLGSWRKASRNKNADSYKEFAETMLVTGIMQAAGIAAVNLARKKYKGALKDDDDDTTLSQEAILFGISTAENIVGSVPILGTELFPGVFSQLYGLAGDKAQARMIAARVGQSGVFSTAARDIHTLVAGAGYFMTLSNKMKAAKTPNERRALKQRGKIRMRQIRNTAMRVVGESTGMPIHQVRTLFPDFEDK